MDLDNLVLEIVSTLPDQQIEGRKRLQKFVHLLKRADHSIPAEFELLHYGPFSRDVAFAADELVRRGSLEEKQEPVGVYRTFQYLYSLPTNSSHSSRLDKKLKKTVMELDNFSTVELEVASTIGFFEDQGCSLEKAMSETRYMKPTKATPRVLDKAKQILEIVTNQPVQSKKKGK